MFEGLRERAGAWLRNWLPEPWAPTPRTLAVDPSDPDRIGFGLGIDRQPLSRPSGEVEDAIRAVSYRPDTNSDGRLTIVSSSTEGDVVDWLLLAKAGQSVHPLARGEQVFHGEAVVFGNRPLSDAEAARLAWALEG